MKPKARSRTLKRKKPVENEPVLCGECKHCLITKTGTEYARCTAVPKRVTDVVTGECSFNFCISTNPFHSGWRCTHYEAGSPQDERVIKEGRIKNTIRGLFSRFLFGE